MRRLRDFHAFQGALYEIAVAALFARQGFAIEFLDDGEHKSTKHCEFIATHSKTGDRIGVEAKSRHRAGVLHQEGTFDASSARADIGRLLDEAIEQAPDHTPFAIFVDLNLSPTSDGWEDELRESVLARCSPDGQENVFNAIVVTNWADHHLADDVAPRNGQLLYAIPACAKHPIAGPEVLTAIIREAQLHGQLPLDMHDVARLARHGHRST